MNSEIVVLGAGGHAKVCIELIRQMGERVAVCVAAPGSPDQFLGVPVLIGDDNLIQLYEQGYRRLFVAIGSNNLRARLSQQAVELGYELVSAVSPKAVISPSARLGVGVAVMAGAVINAEAVIDELAIINTGATIDHDCRIGRAVHIAPQVALAGNVTVGPYSFLGIGAKVVPEVEIGENVTVGAGGVVITHLVSGVTAVGVPAKIIG